VGRAAIGVPRYTREVIGRIGGGQNRRTGKIDVGIIQSLVRRGVVDDRVADYGHVIVDECHHLSAPGFEQVVRQAKARFVLGLSATVARKDGHHPIIFMQCGPVRHQVNARAQAASRPFEHFVLVQPTPFQPNRNPEPDKGVEFQTLYQELTDDQARTWRICEDVMDAVRNGRSPLILTERNNHLDRFEQELATRVDYVVVLRAGMGKKQRHAINERLTAIPRHEGRVILATGKYVGEGFDDPRLDTLFLTLPVSWRGTVAQYAGRLHRLYDGKREVRIYDYADLNVPMLARMFDRRCRGYEAIGYTILLPASAIPGWPADVVLPSDPVWKRDYSGSVRRLIRDGVDTPLATLFVHAARTMREDAEGAARARSASEAFLFRRLDTLAETTGRFRLDVALPIPFDGFGTLEVDLLCADARLAIELDGGQRPQDAAGVGVGATNVGYAVICMVVLRCTQRLRRRLKQSDDEPSGTSSTRLGDWYGNLVQMGRRQALIFISERSRLPVLIPIREANRLTAAFPATVCRMLRAVGVAADDVEDERACMLEITYGRTHSRSLLGTLNDLSFGAHVHFMADPHDTLEAIALRLAETPIMPLDGACPIDLTRGLFGA
jgi:hypothetical protein